jgi:hypothetical protein
MLLEIIKQFILILGIDFITMKIDTNIHQSKYISNIKFQMDPGLKVLFIFFVLLLLKGNIFFYRFQL